jgi:hypothetical protein
MVDAIDDLIEEVTSTPWALPPSPPDVTGSIPESATATPCWLDAFGCRRTGSASGSGARRPHRPDTRTRSGVLVSRRATQKNIVVTLRDLARGRPAEVDRVVRDSFVKTAQAIQTNEPGQVPSPGPASRSGRGRPAAEAGDEPRGPAGVLLIVGVASAQHVLLPGRLTGQQPQ